MMARIREEENKGQRATVTPKMMPLWKRWAVAAALAGVVASAGIGLMHTGDTLLAQDDTQAIYDDEVMEYAMLDNVDIEYYLTQY